MLRVLMIENLVYSLGFQTVRLLLFCLISFTLNTVEMYDDKIIRASQPFLNFYVGSFSSGVY